MFVSMVQSRYASVRSRIAVLAAAIDRYLEMFPVDQREHVRPVVKWAMDVFKKQDRITWFIKRYREDSKVYQDHKVDFAHFADMEAQVPGLRSYRFDDKRSVKDTLQDLKTIEDEALAKKGQALVSAKGEKILEFPGGWAWWNLGVPFCEDEAGSMGHCGNKPSQVPGDQLLSLRREVKVGGETKYEPHLTFILNRGVLGEMKGRANEKPKQKYHRYIVDLLIQYPEIKYLWGGGYAPTQNFYFSDLSEAEQKKVLEAKPELNLQSTSRPIDIDKVYPRDPDQPNRLYFPGDKTNPRKHFNEFVKHNDAIKLLGSLLGEKAQDPRNWLEIKIDPAHPNDHERSSLVAFIIQHAPDGPELQQYLAYHAKPNMPDEVVRAALTRNKDQALFKEVAQDPKAESAHRAMAVSMVKDRKFVRDWLLGNGRNYYIQPLLRHYDDVDTTVEFFKTMTDEDLRAAQFHHNGGEEMGKTLMALPDEAKRRVFRETPHFSVRMRLLDMAARALGDGNKDARNWIDMDALKQKVEDLRVDLDVAFKLLANDQPFLKHLIEKAKGADERAPGNRATIFPLIEDKKFLADLFRDTGETADRRVMALKYGGAEAVADPALVKALSDKAELVRNAAFRELLRRRAYDGIADVLVKTKHKNLLKLALHSSTQTPLKIIVAALKNKLIEDPTSRDTHYEYDEPLRRVAREGTKDEVLDVLMSKAGRFGYKLLLQIQDPDILEKVAAKHPSQQYREFAARKLESLKQKVESRYQIAVKK